VQKLVILLAMSNRIRCRNYALPHDPNYNELGFGVAVNGFHQLVQTIRGYPPGTWVGYDKFGNLCIKE
jgi:hypothetical protein